MIPTSYRGFGLMCGTSHDALDIADVGFDFDNGQWSYTIHEAVSIDLPQNLRERLAHATDSSALELALLDRDFAHFCADQVSEQMARSNSKATFIASHGVTIFHQPDRGIAQQIGNGGIMAMLTGLKVISDFRIQDVSAGGTGAPLVPYADKQLFSDFHYTLNLGGFANISVLHEDEVIGYDLCACNLLLNQLAKREGFDFDAGGKLANAGNAIQELLQRMNALPYFSATPPKSLGYEWVKETIDPLFIEYSQYSTADLLATSAEHISEMIARALEGKRKVLVTGGGAYNTHLIERISAKTASTVVIPDATTIDFREALAFAFLGLLRLLEEPNIDPNVTGSAQQTSAGAVYLPGL